MTLCECGFGGKPCDIEYGFCHCRCGGKTNLAKYTDRKRGIVKGEPLRFIAHHHARTQFGPSVERFWKKVDKHGPLPSAEALAVHREIAGTRCWIYASTAKRGRGTIELDHRTVSAHRAAWYLATGRWPKPCCLHKCDRPGCVRFSHLFEGTQQDNIDDMHAKKRDRRVGERNYMAKLTWADVREIRRIGAPCVRHPRRKGTILLKKRLARRFGTTTDHIDRILSNELWL